MAYHLTRYRPRAMSGVSTQLRPGRVWRPIPMLGSLGDDAVPATTLSTTSLDTPTLTDPVTAQWQGQVLQQLQQGVDTLRTAELQKWLQIVATVSIPLAGVIWKMIFKSVKSDGTGV